MSSADKNVKLWEGIHSHKSFCPRAPPGTSRKRQLGNTASRDRCDPTSGSYQYRGQPSLDARKVEMVLAKISDSQKSIR